MSGLRTGITTGTCAAAAAKAAALALTGRRNISGVTVTLPEGGNLELPVTYARKRKDCGEAAVRKDAGDDPDVTDGITVAASVWRIPGRDIILTAGEGVGTVTKPGLSVPVGQPAINPVPRKMIVEAIREVIGGGAKVVVSIPGGETLAAKTFNPRLGVVGGLSILGTTGLVRPFSSSALRSSLQCSLQVAAACGVKAPIFVPGHIGERAARKSFVTAPEQVIEVSNEWGFMLNQAAAHRWAGLLVLGHPGKLAKLAMGEWDTHSSRSKSAVSFVSGMAEKSTGRNFGDVPTVEGIFGLLSPEARKKVGDRLAGKVREAVGKRIGERFPIAVVLVNMQGTRLGGSGDWGLWQEIKSPS